MSYSQNDEEQALRAFLTANPRGGRPQRFLDVGAHDGVKLSNTRWLAENGWSGTLVEPSPAAFCALMDTYRDREDMNLVHVAVVPDESTLLRFHDARGDFVSTFDEAHRKVWAAPGANGRPGVKFQPIYVASVTFETLLRAFPGPYPVISLDVEGINFDLFRKLPLRDLGTEIVCVEYQDKLPEIEKVAEIEGFRRYHITSENAIFVRKVPLS